MLSDSNEKNILKNKQSLMESTYNSTHVETNGRNKRKLLLQDLLETRLNMNMTSERFRSSVDLENFNLKCLLLCIIV